MATIGHNAAYDLERFARKPAIKEKEITVIRTNRKAKLARERRYFTMVGMTLAMAAIIVVAVTFLYSKVQITELTEQISSMESDLRAAQSETTRLEMEIEGQMSLRNIEEHASALGLTKLQDYQVTCIGINNEDKVVVKEESKNVLSNLWDGLCSFFAQIGSYIGR